MAYETAPVVRCKCAHEYQDSKYGKGNRVHTAEKRKENKSTYTITCTVCGTKRDHQ